jgi:hypothetical protein
MHPDAPVPEVEGPQEEGGCPGVSAEGIKARNA